MAQAPYAGHASRDRRDAPPPPTPPGWRSKIRFAAPLDPELFNSIALEAARRIGLDADGRERNENKRTQLRRFYDELCMWEEKVSRSPDKFSDLLPFIRMMNAKAAYAEGRKPKLVDQNFVDLLQHTLAQVADAKTLQTCKLFWEAFMGFYRQVRKD